MSLKTYAKGSPFPSLEKDRLRLYSMRFCPYAQRARLVLVHKNIPFETINVHLKEKPEWFVERNPKGLVPTLEKNDKVIYESLIVSDYLDEVYPENRLTPKDPYQKALDAILLDYFGNNVTPNFYKIARSEGKDEEAKEALIKGLQKLENELVKRGKFFGGNEVAMIDYMLWPWLERLSLLSIVLSDKFLPKLYTWTQEMWKLPAVKETAFDADTHLQFMKSAFTNNPQYDIGLAA